MKTAIQFLQENENRVLNLTTISRDLIVFKDQMKVRQLEKEYADQVKGDTIRTADGRPRKLLGRSVKVEKGLKEGVVTKIMYLSPANESGFNLCKFALGCKWACLGHSAGRMVYTQSKWSRVLKSWYMKSAPIAFFKQLIREIVNHAINVKKRYPGKIPAIRLNGSSDIVWPRYIDIDALCDIVRYEYGISLKFYDYTKWPIKVYRKQLEAAKMPFPKQYHLTFSIDEKFRSFAFARQWLEAGFNATMVVGSTTRTLKDAKKAQEFLLKQGTIHINGSDYKTINHDLTDIRFRDPRGTVGILHAKGSKALNDRSGFVFMVDKEYGPLSIQ